ncbi:MAG: carboxymuconolactone decarboxylase family protein [Chloroflexi bacterium AL-W]|nr:carboxymuconolactone decarboxylase family protein [Chloroflexi bacterium AL-N1]NOK71281.1 carboxymuconolactone decarboxylase family protein [Chloroflexi bacterium AL-N10]NOK77656.1 carboxymuconolactone decarboxylase family protein [Chloroflexi bacterium AL-N5]NOK84507.1 carboxymuconolactone decarboxylase family protein [Chloroflexi bacterium AL-W]NOK92958.1 carboxymuconolactone decarboxylase family protein [Chloroflexi bacterium AL-N15]
MTDLPKTYRRFQATYTDVWETYDRFGTAVHNAGPLDDKTRAFIKLALSIGAQKEGAVHSHTRKLREQGVTPEEIRHVALLAAPTLGFPTMMAALTWIEDVLTPDSPSDD